ncbi:hypothetical protein [Streptococcus sp. W151]|jgi:hypothetical protein
MKHDKTATLRNMIIRDYSRYRDDLLDTDKSLFERFNELERERNNDIFDYADLLQLLDELDGFTIQKSGDSYKSKIIDYIEKL